jgi:YbbR domain-containing protein
MPGKRASVREAVFNNKWLKLVALVLAVASWYAIRRAISFETIVRDVPLSIDVPEGWAVLDQSVSSVDVLFSGSQAAIRSLMPEHLNVEIDMGGVPVQGSIEVPFTPESVRGAFGGARAAQVRPSSVTLSLDREDEAQVPVKGEIVGEPPVGYTVEKVTCKPASASIYGPLQRLKEVDVLRTQPIDLRGRIRSFDLRVPILVPSDRWPARVEPDTVQVSVTLSEHGEEKVMEEVRVHALSAPELGAAVRIWPTKVQVRLTGRPDLVDALERRDLRVYVDCSELDGTASYTLPVRVHVPAGIVVQEVDPSSVEVEVGEL